MISTTIRRIGYLGSFTMLTSMATPLSAIIPAASHFHFDIIRSMGEKHPRPSQQWINPYCATYLLAKPGATTAMIDRLLNITVAKYVAPQLKQQTNSSLDDMTKHGDYFREYAMPLSHIHLYSNILGEFESNGSITTVRIFMFIAILILLIACVNFMNLSTARSAGRSRDVAVRKVLGASRQDLVTGFLAETALTSLIALLLAILLAGLLLPYFNQLSGKDFHIDILAGKWFLISYLSIPLFLGLLAGSYPALFLSAFKPIKVLRGFWSPALRAAGFETAWSFSSLLSR